MQKWQYKCDETQIGQILTFDPSIERSRQIELNDIKPNHRNCTIRPPDGDKDCSELKAIDLFPVKPLLPTIDDCKHDWEVSKCCPDTGLSVYGGFKRR